MTTAPPDSARAVATSSLSERELQVVRQLALGRSNAEIAADLYLGETTVRSHIARILTKLGLRDRVQIVVFAYESGWSGPDAAEQAAVPAATGKAVWLPQKVTERGIVRSYRTPWRSRWA